MGTLQWPLARGDVASVGVFYASAELFNRPQVVVNGAGADFAATHNRDGDLFKTVQQGTEQKNRYAVTARMRRGHTG